MKTLGFGFVLAAGLLLGNGTVFAQSREVRTERPERETVRERNVPGGVSKEQTRPDKRREERNANRPEERRDNRRDVRPGNRNDAPILRPDDGRRPPMDRNLSVRIRERRLFTASDFEVSAIIRTVFDSDRMSMARKLVEDGGLFYSDQIEDIACAFTFNSDRQRFLAMVYPATLDRCNFFRTLETLTFSSDREETMKNALAGSRPELEREPLYLASKTDVANMVTALGRMSFNSEKKLAARLMISSGQLTARQIASVVKALSFDDDRYELLLWAFPYCTTPREYDQAANALTFSSDRRKLLDELKWMRIGR